MALPHAINGRRHPDFSPSERRVDGRIEASQFFAAEHQRLTRIEHVAGGCAFPRDHRFFG